MRWSRSPWAANCGVCVLCSGIVRAAKELKEKMDDVKAVVPKRN